MDDLHECLNCDTETATENLDINADGKEICPACHREVEHSFIEAHSQGRSIEQLNSSNRAAGIVFIGAILTGLIFAAWRVFQ